MNQGKHTVYLVAELNILMSIGPSRWVPYNVFISLLLGHTKSRLHIADLCHMTVFEMYDLRYAKCQLWIPADGENTWCFLCLSYYVMHLVPCSTMRGSDYSLQVTKKCGPKLKHHEYVTHLTYRVARCGKSASSSAHEGWWGDKRAGLESTSCYTFTPRVGSFTCQA